LKINETSKGEMSVLKTKNIIARRVKSFVTMFVYLNTFLNNFASSVYFFISILIVFDISGRVLFNSPIMGVPEFIPLGMIGAFFLQMAHSGLSNRFINSDVLVRSFPPRIRAIFVTIGDLLTIFFFILMIVALWPETLRAWRFLQYVGEGSRRIPVYPTYTCLIIGGILAITVFTLRIIDRFTSTDVFSLTNTNKQDKE